MIVAQIDKDHIADEDFNEVGREFHYGALWVWWGWEDMPTAGELAKLPKTHFKLYDDDGELYYEGWLLNDNECIVQQFVQRWGEANAGTTTILVHKNEEAGFIQEIG